MPTPRGLQVEDEGDEVWNPDQLLSLLKAELAGAGDPPATAAGDELAAGHTVCVYSSGLAGHLAIASAGAETALRSLC